MKRACLIFNTTGLASSTKLNKEEQHASSLPDYGSQADIRPLKINFARMNNLFLGKGALFFVCLFFPALVPAQKSLPIDRDATAETKALFINLKKLSADHTLFGHQNATEYGRGWSGEEDRSDVKSVCGSHPAVTGVEIGGLSGRSKEEIEKEKIRLQKTVVDMYNRGGVVTLSWHFSNPVSGDGFNWNPLTSARAVKEMIPGGQANEKYREILQTIAGWAYNLKGADGTLAPVIFRPFHEFDGGWFWWGKPHCSREEFISLWQFTVSYLRDSLEVHNFLYAFSPDNKFDSEKEYLERFPGNEWVDLLGMDNYGDMGRDKYDRESAARKLKIISDYADKNGKLAAFTETGLESIPNPVWWTETLLKVMQMYPMKLCYVLVWRNDMTSPTHYYAPVPGHVCVQDFMKFYEDPYTLFLNDLKVIYSK